MNDSLSDHNKIITISLWKYRNCSFEKCFPLMKILLGVSKNSVLKENLGPCVGKYVHEKASVMLSRVLTSWKKS